MITVKCIADDHKWSTKEKKNHIQKVKYNTIRFLLGIFFFIFYAWQSLFFCGLDPKMRHSTQNVSHVHTKLITSIHQKHQDDLWFWTLLLLAVRSKSKTSVHISCSSSPLSIFQFQKQANIQHRLISCHHLPRFWVLMYSTLFPLMKASPYLCFSCPFTYSSVCSKAMFMYPSRHAKTPL